MFIRHPKTQIGTEEKVLIRRITALFLDEIIIIFIIGIFLWIFILTTPEEQLVSNFPEFLLLSNMAFHFFYAFFLEGYMGQTLGKKILKIAVVKEDGFPCTYTASFIRNILRLVDSMIYGSYLVGGLVMLITKRKQRIGDLLGKTVVVKVASESN